MSLLPQKSKGITNRLLQGPFIVSPTFTAQEPINSLPRSQRASRSDRPWISALLSSVSLSLLFVVVYGGSNILASQRELHTLFFKWEPNIPFIPSLIVPYLSIDLFFATSFFLCREAMELRNHVSRIGLAILIAGIFFLLFPLTTGYSRPEVGGPAGALFELLWSFDKPHNLAPSLHIALASLLWPLYARRTTGILRWLIHGWFVLIFISPLFTWQHHLIDIVTGALLGQLCSYLIAELGGAPASAPTGLRDGKPFTNKPILSNVCGDTDDVGLTVSSPNRRVATYYGFGSVILLTMAVANGSWWWLLVWPAVSCAIVAFAYAHGDASIFRKSKGIVPISTRVVLGPYLFGMFLRRVFYRSRESKSTISVWHIAHPGWREISANLYCGRLVTTEEAKSLRGMGVTAVLDMTAEHSETKSLRESAQLPRPATPDDLSARNVVEYLNIPVLDLTQPSSRQLDRAAEFIAKNSRQGKVYVHCALGIARSRAAVNAYLKTRGRTLASQTSPTRPDY